MRRHSLLLLVFFVVFIGLLASPLLLPKGQATALKYKIVISAGNNVVVEIKNMKLYSDSYPPGCQNFLDTVRDFYAGCGGTDAQGETVHEAAQSVMYDVYVYWAVQPGCQKGALKPAYPKLNQCFKIPHAKVWASPGPPEDSGKVAIAGPVGGTTIPIDKLSLLAPYVALATVVVAVTVGAAYARKSWLGKTVIH